MVLKLRTASFETGTKRLTKQEYFLNDVATIVYYAMQLFEEVAPTELELRLLGLTMTGLAPLEFENMSLPLFEQE